VHDRTGESVLREMVLKDIETQGASGLVEGVADGQRAGTASLNRLARDAPAGFRDRTPELR
jgi:hypothetical protein